ncbi:MAG: glutathione S-transferase family protein [Myxococcales bacterium]|nr:glutathione S-transferase family protein [Myxococcales bacterium]
MATLYATSYSSNARKAVALAHQLGLRPPQLEIVDVNVYAGEGQSPDYLEVNPFGRVPALVDGELMLWESNALLIYLSEAYGDDRYWSRDAKQRADIARWLFWESAHFQPTLTEVIGQHAGHIMVPALVDPPKGPCDWDARGLTPLLKHLETRLAERPYLAGAEPTLADFSVIAMTIYFERLDFPFARYPSLGGWYRRVHALDGWRHTNGQPWRVELAEP